VIYIDEPNITEHFILPQNTEHFILPQNTEHFILPQNTEHFILPQNTEHFILPQNTDYETSCTQNRKQCLVSNRKVVHMFTYLLSEAICIYTICYVCCP
jgi:hypothetical protein